MSEKIKNTKECIVKFAKDYGYKINKLSKSISLNQFDSREQLLSEMLNWWSDIKVPQNEEEKLEMMKSIERILQNLTPQDLEQNQVNEIIWCWILEK